MNHYPDRHNVGDGFLPSREERVADQTAVRKKLLAADAALQVCRMTAERDALRAINEELVAALNMMEEGYRERCTFCGGSMRTCANSSAACRAKEARATISRARGAA